MKKDKNIPTVPDNMLSQKTYEDFNKERPNPNEIKKLPLPDSQPTNIEPKLNNDRRQNQVDHKAGENKSEGSE